MSTCCTAPQAEASPKTRLACPDCAKLGGPVTTLLLKHQVKPKHLQAVEDGPFHFCRTPTCEVVYFSARGAILKQDDVRQRIGLKAAQGSVPVCYCFGFTEQMVHEEVSATGKCAIPQRIAAEVKAGNCACEIRNPQGSCCLGNVTAVMKRALADAKHVRPSSSFAAPA
ncbi:MAG: hypothetical protein JSR82_05850 [Verrucomicrobia bacterium]|nr:hypothetical protein [Verrucomicrobiota bacterium]